MAIITIRYLFVSNPYPMIKSSEFYYIRKLLWLCSGKNQAGKELFDSFPALNSIFSKVVTGNRICCPHIRPAANLGSSMKICK